MAPVEKRPAKKKTAKKKALTPKEILAQNDWAALHQTIPRKSWHAFKDFVLEADIGGTLGPIAEKYPKNPIVLLVEDYLENGNRRKMTLALKAVAGRDERYELYLMKA